MRVFLLGSLAAVILGLFVGWLIYIERVPPGHKGIIVDMLSGDESKIEVVDVGRYFIGPYEELYTFPTFTQNYVWTRSVEEGSPVNEEVQFQDKDGLNFSGDFGVKYIVQKDKVAKLFTTSLLESPRL